MPSSNKPNEKNYDGIADVDPEKLTQMGEAIDPERTREAHEDVREQREKLPVSPRH